MNEIIEALLNRRCIRQFKEEQIKDDELEQIIEAAIHAPNARNQQMWHFTVVQDKDMIEKMVNVTKENIMNSGIEFLIGRASEPGYHTYYHAPTVIIITGEENTQFVEIDGAMAAQNILLAAKSLGIASVIMTSPELLFMGDTSDAIKQELGIPQAYKHVCAISLGYAACQNPDTPPRNRDVVNYIR